MSRDYKIIVGIFILAWILQGGLFAYSYLFLGGVAAIFLIRFRQLVPAWFLLILGLGTINVMISLDKGMAFYGLLRLCSVMLIFILIYHVSREVADMTEWLLHILPWGACGMVVLSAASYIFPMFKGWFFQAGRMGGFFQYANTCALFLCLSLISLLDLWKTPREGSFSWRWNKSDVLSLKSLNYVIILIGLFMTGSRFGILIFAIIFAFELWKNKELRGTIVILTVPVLVIGFIYVRLSGNFQNFGRILTIGSRQSTVWGRLLYMKDALSLIISHPFGIGYMGFDEMQGNIQSGVYRTVFVHNDLLQFFLDYGWGIGAIILAFLVWNVFWGKQSVLKKKMLICVMISSIVDFHMQFCSIIIIILLCVEIPSNWVKKREKHGPKKLEVALELVPVAIIFIYFSVAQFCQVHVSPQLAYEMYSGDTQALEAMMREEADVERAVNLANLRLDRNPYSSEAWNILSYASYMQGDFDKALTYQLQAITYDRYNEARYECLEGWIEQLREYEPELCQKAAKMEQQILEETREGTSSLAWKIRDKPFFSRM